MFRSPVTDGYRSGSSGVTHRLSSLADNATLVIHSEVISCLLDLRVLNLTRCVTPVKRQSL